MRNVCQSWHPSLPSFDIGYIGMVLYFTWFQLNATFPPSIVAYDDSTEVLEDVSVRILVLRNDQLSIEASIDTHSLLIIEDPKKGSAKILSTDGTIVYTPVKDFHGTDSLVYRVCTKGKECSSATVRITVHPVNDAPVANDDFGTLWEDDSIWIDILFNDHDDSDHVEFDPSQMLVLSEPRFGTVSIHGNQIFYKPRSNYFGNDFFYYSICDQSLCDTAKVLLNIQSVNDSPEVNPDWDTTFQGLVLVMDVLQNDFDTLDFSELDFTSIALDGLLQPKHAFTFVDTTVGLLLYVPREGFIGYDTFEYRVCDYGPEEILCDTASVFIKVSETPDDLYQFGVDETVSYKVIRKSKSKSITDVFENNSGDVLLEMIREQLQMQDLYTGRYRYFLDADGRFQISQFSENQEVIIDLVPE